MLTDLPDKPEYLVGIVSDTHGRLTNGALRALEKVDLIVHAGDIGEKVILSALQRLAPVVAVRGNMDRQAWATTLSSTEAVEVGRAVIYVVHDLGRLDVQPAKDGIKVVVSGHTHRPSIVERKGVLYIDPGSVSQPRGQHPPTVALLHVRGDSVDAAIVELFD